MKTQFPAATAQSLARFLLGRGERACLPGRIMIAGSLRRGRATVGDLEVLYIPQIERYLVSEDLFTKQWSERPLFDGFLDSLVRSGVLAKRLSPYRGILRELGEEPVEMESEEAVFAAAGWPWLEPHERTDDRIAQLTEATHA